MEIIAILKIYQKFGLDKKNFTCQPQLNLLRVSFSMKVLLITIAIFLTSAGGIPLDKSYVTLPEVQTKFIATLKDLHDAQMEQILSEITAHVNEPLDPEYVEILKEFEKNNNLNMLTHRDLQWKSVGQVMLEINVEERITLIETVRRFPLYRRLPPTVAISPLSLSNWNKARTVFLGLVKDAPKRAR